MIKYLQTDDDIKISLEELRQQHSNINEIDTGAKTGNFIMGDFQEIDDNNILIE